MSWIRHTSPKVVVEVKGGMTLKKHANGFVVADGSEQILTEIDALAKFSGFIDLSPMQAVDEVVVREYMKVLSEGPYVRYEQATYPGSTSSPALYITPKVLLYGGRVTLQQTAGVFKTFSYNFVREGEE